MYKNILIPVDGSATSLRAVAQAKELAKALGSQVTVIYVLDPYPFTGVGADFAYSQSQYLTVATEEANKILDSVKASLEEANLTVKTLLSEDGIVHEGIVRTSQNVGADLIVMGSHGRKGLEKILLGSVAQRVLQTASIPVLIVRGVEEVK